MQWQYLVLYLRRVNERQAAWFDATDREFGRSDELAAILNDLGEDRWELVAVCTSERHEDKLVLKRPKQ